MLPENWSPQWGALTTRPWLLAYAVNVQMFTAQRMSLDSVIFNK
jgi:hypothetical protein